MKGARDDSARWTQKARLHRTSRKAATSDGDPIVVPTALADLTPALLTRRCVGCGALVSTHFDEAGRRRPC